MYWNSISFVEGLAGYLCALFVFVLMRRRQPGHYELPAYIYLAFASGVFIDSFAYVNWVILLLVIVAWGLNTLVSKQIIGEKNSTTVTAEYTGWLLTIIAIFSGIGLSYSFGQLISLIVVLIISLSRLFIGSSVSSTSSSK
jgi:hypothetical protein